MKKTPRKLRIGTQIIRTLAAAQLGAVAGGCDTTSDTTDGHKPAAPPRP